jgi:hypothetical protein
LPKPWLRSPSTVTVLWWSRSFRPVFKDDEPLMIAVGAVLGGLVGELQVQVIELFTH